MLLEYGSDPTAELEDGTKPGQKFDGTVPAETQKVRLFSNSLALYAVMHSSSKAIRSVEQQYVLSAGCVLRCFTC
jgi:hypothetical protein